MNTEETFLKFIACPKCHNGLSVGDEGICCKECGSSYSKNGECWDFRTILKDDDKHWYASEFDRVFKEKESEYEDAMLHALKMGIPRFAEEYRQNEKTKLVKDFIVKNKPSRILDLGCGYGWLCLKLQELCPDTEFFGIDISGFRINTFKEQISRIDCLRTIIPSIANGESIPFAEQSFDAVIMCEVLEHLQDPEQTFKEVQRILKPNGIVMITTPSKSVTKFWNFMAVVPTVIKRWMKKEPLSVPNEYAFYDVPLSIRNIRNLITKYQFKTLEWRRVIYLPHESYLQFIPLFLLRIMIMIARIMKVVPFLGFMGLHHVIFLEKNNGDGTD